ncbi:NAD(P)-dependent oxidoreductase [Simiduia aestuariiviva]|uniref:Phosphoglycerate dehydrogenase-like enzyme n=1 Tax=Simiduia aestuariiviva TaxID=1510459 RepID=A0A839UMK5_9GAMM|nr:phosphoglycerate dehydrogenase-like enzyme [Simiduia aestuariiviva]
MNSTPSMESVGLILARDAQSIAEALPDAFAASPVAMPDLLCASTPTAAMAHIGHVDFMLAQPSLAAPLLAGATRLRWLQSTFAGVEPLMAPDLRRDYQLTGVKGIFGPLMCEYVFGKLLEINRHFAHYHASQSQRQWQPQPYRSLAGQTLAVVGLGSIGRAIAQMAKHFGMRVIGVNRSGDSMPGLDQCFSLTQALAEGGLAGADAVVLALPSTPALARRCDADFFAQLKSGAVVINVGRGAVIDEAALLHALESGKLSAAVLDVFDQEPLPPSHPLWQAPNVHITPHISAVTFARDIAQVFADNYLRYVSGKPLLHAVDFTRGY